MDPEQGGTVGDMDNSVLVFKTFGARFRVERSWLEYFGRAITAAVQKWRFWDLWRCFWVVGMVEKFGWKICARNFRYEMERE